MSGSHRTGPMIKLVPGSQDRDRIGPGITGPRSDQDRTGIGPESDRDRSDRSDDHRTEIGPRSDRDRIGIGPGPDRDRTGTGPGPIRWSPSITSLTFLLIFL